MTEENLAATSLQIEDVVNPQSVSFTPDPKEPAKAPTAREAIEASLADIEAKDGKRLPDNPRDEKVEPKKADKETPNPVKDEGKVDPAKERAPDGKFAPKQTENPQNAQPENVNSNPDKLDAPKPPAGERDITRAPDNFLPRAKERWAEAPEEVRGEFYRALDNFEKGKAEYQEDREFRKSVREYEELAKNAGVDFKSALKNYVEIDQMVSADPVEGIRRILGAQKIDLIQFAQHVLGQAQAEQANPALAQTKRLEQQVQQLSQHLQGMTQAQMQAQQESAKREAAAEVDRTLFTEMRSLFPRFDELRPAVYKIYTSDILDKNELPDGRDRLIAAIDYAERLNPAPNSRQNAQRPINPAGEKSIKGSLTNGLDIVSTKGVKLNGQDSLNAAWEQLGF